MVPGGGRMLAQHQDTDQDTTEDLEEPTEDEVDELLVEEVSIDGMCGVY